MTLFGKLIRVGAGLITGNANAVQDIIANRQPAIQQAQNAVGITSGTSEQGLFKSKEEKADETFSEIIKKYAFHIVGAIAVIVFVVMNFAGSRRRF